MAAGFVATKLGSPDRQMHALTRPALTVCPGKNMLGTLRKELHSPQTSLPLPATRVKETAKAMIQDKNFRILRGKVEDKDRNKEP